MTADAAAPVAAPETRAAPEPERRSTRAATVPSPGSTLTVGERAEYHYVERDLRNIGVLTVIMLGMLLAAWFIFSGLGLVA